jgi:hypothetical protein
VRFTTASQPVHAPSEARGGRRLLRLRAQLARVSLRIVDELRYVRLFQTGSELLFEVFSQRYERGACSVVMGTVSQGMNSAVHWPWRNLACPAPSVGSGSISAGSARMKD